MIAHRLVAARGRQSELALLHLQGSARARPGNTVGIIEERELNM